MQAGGWVIRGDRFIRSYLTAAGREAAANLLGLTFWSVAAHGCAFLTLLLLLRALPPQEYGTLSFVLALQNSLAMIASGGTAAVLIREGVRRPERLDEIATSHLLLAGAIAVSLSLLLLAGTLLPLDLGAERYLLVLLALGNIPVSLNLLPLYDVHHRQARCAFLSLLAEGAALACLALLARNGALNLATAGSTFAAKWSATTVTQFIVYQTTIRRFRWIVSWQEVWSMARSGLPLLVASLTVTIPFTSGIFFVRGVGAASELPLMGLTHQVGGVVLFFVGGVYRILQPHMVGRHGMERSFLRKLGVFLAAFLTSLSASAFAGVLILVSFFLPPVYVNAVVPAGVLLGAFVVLGICGAAHIYLIRLHDERVLMAIYTGGSVLYALGCLLIVPHWGTLGAVSTTFVIALLVTGVAFARLAWKWGRESACGLAPQ